MTPRTKKSASRSESHRTKPEHGDQTRAALVAAARKLFASRGYGDVALQDVSDRAGVTRGALYHHFPGKEALFRAVCEDVAGDVTQGVAASVADKPSAWDRLRAGCHAFLDACTQPAVRRILLTDAPSVLGWEGFREIDNRHGLGLLKIGLRSAIEEGAIEEGPVDSLAHVLVGALNEAAMVVGRARDTKRARRDATIAIDRVLEGFADNAGRRH